MRKWLYEKYKNFITWLDDIYLAHEPPLCKAEQIKKLFILIQPGDIVCRGYNYYLDSYLIPGDYTHSSVVVKKDKMVHVTAKTGAEFIHPIDFIKDTDRFIILRPKYSSELLKQHSVKRALWHVEVNKTEYDCLFNSDDKFYCHELAVDCLSYTNIKISKTPKFFGIWPIKFRNDLYLVDNLISECDIVYEFNP